MRTGTVRQRLQRIEKLATRAATDGATAEQQRQHAREALNRRLFWWHRDRAEDPALPAFPPDLTAQELVTAKEIVQELVTTAEARRSQDPETVMGFLRAAYRDACEPVPDDLPPASEIIAQLNTYYRSWVGYEEACLPAPKPQ